MNVDDSGQWSLILNINFVYGGVRATSIGRLHTTFYFSQLERFRRTPAMAGLSLFESMKMNLTLLQIRRFSVLSALVTRTNQRTQRSSWSTFLFLDVGPREPMAAR